MQGSDMAVSLVPEEGGVDPLPTATRFHFPFGLAHKKKEEKEEEKKVPLLPPKILRLK